MEKIMYTLDLTAITSFLTAVWQAIGGVLRLDPDVYRAIISYEYGGGAAMAVLFLGTLSLAIGQSVVLFANRVQGARFALSLIMLAAMLMSSVLIWSTAMWITLVFLFGFARPLADIFIVVGLGFAPLIFGFLVLIPYLGRIIYRLLSVWIMLTLFVGVFATFQMSIAQSLFAGLLGWLLFGIVASASILQRIEAWVWRVVTGKTTQLDTQEAVDQFVQEIQQIVSQERTNKNEATGGA